MKHMDNLMRRQNEMDQILKEEQKDLFEVPKFLRGKKRA